MTLLGWPEWLPLTGAIKCLTGPGIKMEAQEETARGRAEGEDDDREARVQGEGEVEGRKD